MLDVRLRAVGAAAAALVLASACAASPSGVAPSPSQLDGVAMSKAADLRTHLDLLLAEHVMIVAKQSAAAVNFAAEYGGYGHLLSANSTDLEAVYRKAFGTTAAASLRSSWDALNSVIVDYAIAVASHDPARSQADARAASDAATQHAQLLAGQARLPRDATVALFTAQATMERALVDDYAAKKFAAFYADLDHAYAHAQQLGDAIAKSTARSFPDKFPGDPTRREVDTRVAFNLLLQEDSYLSTMATGARVAARAADAAAATRALATSAGALRGAFAAAIGNAAAVQSAELWSARNDALIRHASGDFTADDALKTSFVTGLATLTHAPASSVGNQVAAILKAIDDQLAKATDAVAGDDRAAATAWQPVADATRS